MKHLKQIGVALFAVAPWLCVAVSALAFCESTRNGLAVASFCCICAALAWDALAERVR